MLVFLDNYNHTDLLASTDFIFSAAKIHHADIVLQVPNSDTMVMLLLLEAKKIHMEANMKRNKNQDFLPLILNLV